MRPVRPLLLLVLLALAGFGSGGFDCNAHDPPPGGDNVALSDLQCQNVAATAEAAGQSDPQDESAPDCADGTRSEASQATADGSVQAVAQSVEETGSLGRRLECRFDGTGSGVPAALDGRCQIDGSWTFDYATALGGTSAFRIAVRSLRIEDGARGTSDPGSVSVDCGEGPVDAAPGDTTEIPVTGAGQCTVGVSFQADFEVADAAPVHSFLTFDLSAPSVFCDSDLDCPAAEAFCVQDLCRDGEAGSECRNRNDCGAGLLCNSFQECSAGLDDDRCAFDFECTAGRSCIESTSRCAVTPGPLGAACDDGGDCVSGLCLGFPGATFCESGDLGAFCTADADCKSDLFCNGAFCSGCLQDSDCGDNRACVGALGACSDELQSCASSDECSGDDFCTFVGTRGFACVECLADSQCSALGANAVCLGASCRLPCLDDAGCGAGESCFAGFCEATAPCAADADCGPGGLCCPSLGVCADPASVATGSCEDDADCSASSGCCPDLLPAQAEPASCVAPQQP